jgi:hypothetical protein
MSAGTHQGDIASQVISPSSMLKFDNTEYLQNQGLRQHKGQRGQHPPIFGEHAPQ